MANFRGLVSKKLSFRRGATRVVGRCIRMWSLALISALLKITSWSLYKLIPQELR